MRTLRPATLLVRGLVAIVSLGVVALTSAPPPAVAQQPRPALPGSVDARLRGALPQEVDEAALARVGPHVRALPGTLSRGPRTLWSSDGALTPPSNKPAEQVARQFLLTHRDLYGATRAVTQIELASGFTTSAGVTHLRFRQTSHDIEIFQGEIKAAVDAQGRLIAINGSLLPHTAPGRATLSASDALAAAATSLGTIAPPAPPVASGPSGADSATTFAQGAYFRPPGARLVVFPTTAGGRLAWHVTLPVHLVAWYDTVLDARTGELLYRSNLVADAGPEGMVYAANDDPDDGPQSTVPFAGSLSAPRDAWLPPLGTTTEGNNVVAGIDRDGDGVHVPASSGIQHFDFAFADAYETSGGTDPYTDQAAAVTNVFYWNNYVHDYYYTLGFTEAAGNFQFDNYGAGGLGNDPVVALVQFGADTCPPIVGFCFNNAFFISPSDGGAPFMIVLMLQPPHRYLDGAFASDVLIHEYTHGLSVRLIGDVAGIQSGAMGEAWGDWFGGHITDDPVLAEYWDGDTVNGIRFYSMAANPTTYSDLCNVTGGCEVHADGEIWSGTLWAIRTALVGAHGAAPGRAAAAQLVVDGMMLTPGHPSFLEARDAMLQAEIANGGDDDHCLLWTEFAARGMGDSAISFGDSADVIEAFDLPLECQYPGPDSDGDGMPDSYETPRVCLNAGVADSGGNPDTDGLTSGVEYALGTNPCNANSDGDVNGDGDPIIDGTDNCPLVVNPTQANTADINFVDLPPTKAFDDLTWPNSDSIGDVCDPDDDNDGMSDGAESGAYACAFGPNATLPMNRDSDNDRALDLAECMLGFNPASASSVPGSITPDSDSDRLPDVLESVLDTDPADADTDDDGVLDGVEFRFYNTNPLAANSDDDLCGDAKEIASVNGDAIVTSGDLQQVAQSFGSSTGPNYIAGFDTNKDGSITSADLSFVAQRFGGC